MTYSAGLINFVLRRANNIHLQTVDVIRDHLSEIKNQKPAVIKILRLSGSGKSSNANPVEKSHNI